MSTSPGSPRPALMRTRIQVCCGGYSILTLRKSSLGGPADCVGSWLESAFAAGARAAGARDSTTYHREWTSTPRSSYISTSAGPKPRGDTGTSRPADWGSLGSDVLWMITGATWTSFPPSPRCVRVTESSSTSRSGCLLGGLWAPNLAAAWPSISLYRSSSYQAAWLPWSYRKDLVQGTPVEVGAGLHRRCVGAAACRPCAEAAGRPETAVTAARQGRGQHQHEGQHLHSTRFPAAAVTGLRAAVAAGGHVARNRFLAMAEVVDCATRPGWLVAVTTTGAHV